MAKTESVWIKEEVEEDWINDNDKKVKTGLLHIGVGSKLALKAIDDAIVLKEELIDVKHEDTKHEVSQHDLTDHKIKILPHTAIGPTTNDNTCSVDKSDFSKQKTNQILMCETELAKHSKTHTSKQPFEGTTSLNTLEEGKTNPHTKTHKGKRTLYACNTCDYKSDRKNNFKVHLKRHAGEKKFDCSFCDYKSIDRSGLALHMQRKHTNEKQFSCKTCEYKSGDKAGLRLHTKFIHLKEKPFACPFCDYKSVLRGNLNQHLNRHTAAKQFGCELCNYKSVDKSGLEKHVKRMHVDEKLFDCSVCDYKAVVKSDLHKHMRRRHKGLIDKTGMKSFGCDSCDYKSATKRDLEQHIKRHIEEKPFVCNVYDYKTHCNAYLKQEN